MQIRDKSAVRSLARVAWGVAEKVYDPEIHVTPWSEFHVTLRFLPNAPDGLEHRMGSDWQEELPRPFSFRLGVGETRPAQGPKRSVGVRIVEGVEEFELLQRRIDRELLRLGIPPPREPFRPFVTVATFDPPVPSHWSYDFKVGGTEGVAVEATQLSLLRSGSVKPYPILQTWSLQGRSLS